MKTLNALFSRKSQVNSIDSFSKLAMSNFELNKVRGGDGNDIIPPDDKKGSNP